MEITLTYKIKAIRYSKGMSLNDLSKRSGVSKSYICDIEKGTTTPSIYSLVALAYALDCKIEELYTADISG